MMTEVAGQGNFMVKLSAAHIEPHWQPGSEVLLSWMPAHLRALEGGDTLRVKFEVRWVLMIIGYS